MKLLRRYIGTTVIGTILMVVLVIISLEMFINFTSEFSDMGTGNYGLMRVIIYVFMCLPGAIYQFFPMAGLLGSLIGLGLMASRSELIVMRAAGVSLVQITGTVILAALLILAVAVFLGEVVGPPAQHAAAVYKAKSMSQGQELYTRHGTWVRNGQDFLHIGTISGKKHLADVTRYKFDDQRKLQAVSFAKQGVYEHHKWHFTNIATTIFADNQKVMSKHYSSQDWQLEFNPRLLTMVGNGDDDTTASRSLPDLHAYIKYLKNSGLQANKYEFDFWQRILQPLVTLVMILLAVPFIFGPLRSVTMGLRILAGTVVGFSVYLIDQFIAPVSIVYQLPPLAAASLPVIFIAVVGVVLLMRAK